MTSAKPVAIRISAGQFGGQRARQVRERHFGQRLRQARERHGDIGQVLGHGVVHDAEELRRARRGVDLARPELPKHVAADHDGDLQLPVALGCCSRREVLSVALFTKERAAEVLHVQGFRTPTCQQC